MRPIPYTLLVPERQAYIQKAHRMRSAAFAGLVRDLARLVAGAAR